MRLHRLLAFSTAIMALSSTACSVPTAPFSDEVMNVAPGYMCGDVCPRSNSMKFYAPDGVYPQVDFVIKKITTNSPDAEVIVRLERDPDKVCTVTDCTKVPWLVYLEVRAKKVGEIEVIVFLRVNPNNNTIVRVVSSESNYYNGKG